MGKLSHDWQYIDCINYILKNGILKSNRTGIDTVGVFGYQMKFDLRDGTIPLLTTKKVHTKSIIHELLWFIKGDMNVKYLNDNGVTIWNEWADENGDLGPVYGHQWRKWPTYKSVGTQKSYPFNQEDQTYEDWFKKDQPIDQIAQVVDKLKNNPTDRRMIVSAWNPADLLDMKLPPCHYCFQLYTRPLNDKERMLLATQLYHPNDIMEEAKLSDLNITLNQLLIPKYELSLMLNQRSCDLFLGVPFNIAQYGIFLHMFCDVGHMVPGDLIWNGGDVHIYLNHLEQVKEQRTRQPFPSPSFRFARNITDIDDFKYEDFIIENYQHHPAIKGEVAV